MECNGTSGSPALQKKKEPLNLHHGSFLVQKIGREVYPAQRNKKSYELESEALFE